MRTFSLKATFQGSQETIHNTQKRVDIDWWKGLASVGVDEHCHTRVTVRSSEYSKVTAVH